MAIKTLQMRKTKLSTAVEKMLDEATQPLSVPSLLQALGERGLSPNKTTLYRMLDRFCAVGQTRKIVLSDGVAHYEKASAPHGHFVCTACDAIECLPSFDPQVLLGQRGPDAQPMVVTGAQVSVQGVCAQCL